jgi:cytochrome c-type biogenesis protein CcsB
MEELARFAFWSGLTASGLAVALHWAYLVGALAPRRSAAGLTEAGMVVVSNDSAPTPNLRRAATSAAWVSFAVLTVSLIARTFVLGHAPISNMYEYSTAFGWAVTGYALAFETRLRQAWIGAAALPVAFGMLLVASFFPSAPEPLQPALQNSRMLTIHVSMMVLSYSAFAIAFAASCLYLVQGGNRRFASLPAGKSLDEVTHTAVLIGFPMLALGIALGAWWANDAWGRYWGWDPKETSALATWLLFAAYLHARTVRAWRGQRSSWLVIVGFAGIIFTYYIVNLWIAGLHSYAGV